MGIKSDIKCKLKKHPLIVNSYQRISQKSEIITGRSKNQVTIPYGRNTYGPKPVLLGSMPYITKMAQGSKIGNFCSIAPGLRFSFLGKHNYQWVTTYPFYDLYRKWKLDVPPVWSKGIPDISKIEPVPIIIENDVWVASDVTIKEGVTVSNGAVIAMNSLVTKDVPPYAIVGGNPAKLIKYRFTQSQINDLLKISWWNWTDEEISRVLPLMMSDNIDAFIRTVYDRKQLRS